MARATLELKCAQLACHFYWSSTTAEILATSEFWCVPLLAYLQAPSTTNFKANLASAYFLDCPSHLFCEIGDHFYLPWLSTSQPSCRTNGRTWSMPEPLVWWTWAPECQLLNRVTLGQIQNFQTGRAFLPLHWKQAKLALSFEPRLTQLCTSG